MTITGQFPLTTFLSDSGAQLPWRQGLGIEESRVSLQPERPERTGVEGFAAGFVSPLPS
jgi:hypothetical protein